MTEYTTKEQTLEWFQDLIDCHFKVSTMSDQTAALTTGEHGGNALLFVHYLSQAIALVVKIEHAKRGEVVEDAAPRASADYDGEDNYQRGLFHATLLVAMHIRGDHDDAEAYLQGLVLQGPAVTLYTIMGLVTQAHKLYHDLGPYVAIDREKN